MNKRNLIPRFLSLTLLLMACFLALRDGLCIDWWSTGSLVLTSLMVSLFVALICWNRKTALAGILLAVATEGALAFVFRRQLYQECLQYYHHVIPIINSYYRTGYLYEETAPAEKPRHSKAKKAKAEPPAKTTNKDNNSFLILM